MDTVLFIASIVCLALVVVWYVVNESARASGEKGFLAIAQDKREIKAPSYRQKKRVARGSAEAGDDAYDDAEAAPAFSERKGGFRDKSDEGYKSTAPLPRFSARAAKRPPEKSEN